MSYIGLSRLGFSELSSLPDAVLKLEGILFMTASFFKLLEINDNILYSSKQFINKIEVASASQESWMP